MLKVRDLNCQRHHQKLFSSLTFSLAPGSCLNVLGPNGAGKSSLLKILTGLIAPSAGLIEYTGDFIYIGHQLGLKLSLNPIENLSWWLGIQARHDLHTLHTRLNTSLASSLQSLKLDHLVETPCSRLSAGQCKKLSLLKLVLHSVPLWFLDEPYNALDQAGVDWFEIILKNHLNRGGMAVIASHHLLDLKTDSCNLTAIYL